MLENLLGHLFVLNKSEDPHLTLALGTGQGVKLIYFLNQSGTGAVFIEGTPCGLVNVASNCDGIPEAIEDSVTGVLFQTENTADLVKKLKIFIFD
jgi:glycosyltransferase involved in cell wall biosynthesis